MRCGPALTEPVIQCTELEKCNRKNRNKQRPRKTYNDPLHLLGWLRKKEKRLRKEIYVHYWWELNWYSRFKKQSFFLQKT